MEPSGASEEFLPEGGSAAGMSQGGSAAGSFEGEPQVGPLEGAPAAGSFGEDPDAMLRSAGLRLAERAEEVLPGWLARRAVAVLRAAPASEVANRSADVVSAAQQAGVEAAVLLRELAVTDADRQRTTPLSAVRAAVAGPGAVLRAAGVPVPEAGASPARRLVEGDDYELAPRSWAEVDGELAELALVWGATKAAVHRRRHGA
ncbi:MAG: hypothetical protein M0Z63_11070 [Actinomycetota bacterium]|jgi:hypothetical protein|nr:hypothetical protein [Actinomycetota bacterium]